ncbi:MAG: radical SAM family heme chaperone HemW [Ruminococcaceae bacterium]|nr:radical SAM family heme chaperone HemW [Oscillospiraceae bacterium]
MSKSVGLYIHVPFCKSKCPYCDFYSVANADEYKEEYKKAVLRNIEKHQDVSFDTVYFGGGTPILLWAEICEILDSIGDRITENAEITLEANPCSTSFDKLCSLKQSGVNRISFGLQSGDDKELKALGRLHNSKEGADAVILAEKSGIKNISADIMIGIPFQTKKSLENTLVYMIQLPLSHISAYMLKIEPDTVFARKSVQPADEELMSELYLKTVDHLNEKGFSQYEISNFSKVGYESKHNLKYWKCEEYIGIGPSAHSYFDGKRFSVDRNLIDFMECPVQKTVITDDNPGDYDEWAMLKLRLSEGIDFKTAKNRYNISKEQILNRCKLIPKNFIEISESGLRLTKEGFLVSNAIIGIISDI